MFNRIKSHFYREETVMTRNEIKTIIIKLIAEQLGVPADTIQEQATLDSLGADSLDRVELVMKLEEEFRIEINDEDAEHKLSSVGQLIDYISSLKQ